MSRSLSAILMVAGIATLLLVAQTAHAASLTIGIEAAEAEAGGQIDVPITADVPDAVGAVQLELTFDPDVLNATEVIKGALIAGNSLLEFNTDVEGTVAIAIASLDDIVGDGELVIVSFEVVGSDGDTTEIGVADARAWESENHLEVLVETDSATLTVAAGSSLPIALIAAVAAVLVLLVGAALMMRRRRAVAA